MPTVNNTVYNPNGDAVEGAKVEIELVYNSASQAVAIDSDNDRIISGTYSTLTDSDGEWSATLVANEDITPASSVYKVTERIANVNTVYYISVPADGATPAPNWIGDILTTAPSYV